jgi:hypothetical protein
MKFLGTVTIFICFALALTILNARAQSSGPTNAFGNPVSSFGRSYYGTDTRAACALYYRRYGKLCGRPVIRRKVWR